MAEYEIVTDSGCDIDGNTLKKWGVKYCPLTFRFEDEIEHSNDDMKSCDFYNRMRSGEVSKTSAVNSDSFVELFDSVLSEGKDVLYIGFSSGVSCTYNSARLAAEEMADKYPERSVVTIDSLSASAGQGLLLYFAVEKKKSGFDLSENEKYIRDILINMAHWFTVEDLVYLKRGGRVSAAAALAGGVLGIKPVMHVNDGGALINVSKVRGRAASIKMLAKKYSETALDPENGVYFISHGDCMDDAKMLEDLIFNAHKNKCTLITDVGPVIGSHSGPGTLALFFLGKER